MIADEPSTALDVTTQKEILDLLRSLQEARGLALLIITHDLRVAFTTASRIYVMYAGTVVETGRSGSLKQEPRHPYTLGLLLSEPPVDRRFAELMAIPGSVPRPDEVADRCCFAARCMWAMDVCRRMAPPLAMLEGGQRSACVRTGQIRDAMRQRLNAAQPVHALPVLSQEVLVRVDCATKVFRNRTFGGERLVYALNGVSLTIRKGESVGLVGELGSGKTTLARCLVGLERPSAGRIVGDGMTVEGGREPSRPAAVGQSSADGFSGSLFVVQSDADSREYPRRGRELAEQKEKSVDDRVRELLDLAALPASYGKRKPVALSGGERQRVAIARAMAVRPRILVCDEPVSALDVSVQAQILNLFSRLRREFDTTYMFITHDLAVVRQVTETVHVLYKGSIVESGETADVLDYPKHEYTRRLIQSIPLG